MKLLHEKSECCGAKIIRFGAKRRQCTACKKTWRVHPAKRGPKPRRKQCGYLRKVFEQGFAVKQLSINSRLSEDAIYKVFANNLERVAHEKRIVRIRGDKLILVIDAQWQYFRTIKGKKKVLWTLYFISAKSTDTQKVTILDPVLKQGKENAVAWRQILDELPLGIKKRVIAVVSDGIRGIESIAEDNSWILQRCHFHLLSALQKRRGKRASTPGRKVRQEIYFTVKLFLVDDSPERLDIMCKRLAFLAKEPECPAAMRMIVREFLRHSHDYRAYLEYPELNLPTTVNVMESNNSYVRGKTKKVNTPRAWYRWALACARIKSKFTCK
jgi:hypothetical protein